MAAGTSAPMPMAAKAKPANHDGKISRKRAGDGEAVLVAGEHVRVLRHTLDPDRERHEAEERQERQNQRIGRQQGRVAADDIAGRGTQDRRDGMRVHEECCSRTERQGGIETVGSRRSGRRWLQDEGVRRNGREDGREAAEPADHDADRGEDRRIDHQVLDDRDGGRCAKARRIGEGRQDDEGDDQRQVAREPRGLHPEAGDHDFEADELQRDIRHGGRETRERDGQGQPAIAEAPPHEIGRRDVAVAPADRPQTREDHERHGIDERRVGHREKRDRSRSERQRRHGDERIGRIDVAADQEPRDQRPERTAAESPFMQKVEIGPAPIGGREAQDGHAAETQHEDRQGDPIDRHSSL